LERSKKIKKRPVPRGYWRNKENRRKRLYEFATKMGFDPLVADNWERQPSKNLPVAVGGMASAFNWNCRRAIAETLTELEFSPRWLAVASRPRRHWKDRSNRRKYLHEYAAQAGFDPLIAQNWEEQDPNRLKESVRCMIHIFKGSYKLAIVDAFPELTFSPDWLVSIAMKNRKRFSIQITP